MAKRMVLLAAAALSLSACNNTSKQDEAQVAAQAAETAARERELATFRERANSLEDPDEVLALLRGKELLSQEGQIVKDRLTVLVRPRIEQAETQAELRELKKYTLPGSSLMLDYMQRDSDLSRNDK